MDDSFDQNIGYGTDFISKTESSDIESYEDLLEDTEENITNADADAYSSKTTSTSQDYTNLYAQEDLLTIETDQNTTLSSHESTGALSELDTEDGHHGHGGLPGADQSLDTNDGGAVQVLEASSSTDSASAAKPTATPEEFADYLVNGFWADTGRSARSWSQDNVTFSVSDEFTAAQKDGLRMSFDMWSDIADISFTEVASDADITILEGDDSSAWSGSSTSGSTIISNTISIDTDPWYWTNIGDIGDYATITAIHEIGHSLGLGHSGDYNGSANYTDDAQWANDTRQYSVMSYFDADKSGADHSDADGWQYSSTPMLYDILAIQTIYGANNTVRSGDTTYGFNSNAGRDQFDFSITDDPVVAIWDSGGTDTLDLSGYSVAQTIRLGDGEFSNVGGMTKNVAIAINTTIENAVGGSGVDNIYGNSADNVILGGAGNDVLFGSTGSDTLNGQTGTDTANYSYTVDSFAFNFIDSVTVSINNLAESWTDLVSNIENFIFTDGSYTFAELEAAFADTNDYAPTVTRSNLSLNIDDVILASSVISANDADGDTLTYQIWDDGEDATSGYFELNGSIFSAGKGHTLTEAEFAQLNIVAGDNAGTETLWVRVSDGEYNSGWEGFSLETLAGGSDYNGGAPPGLTANDLSLNTNDSVLASSVITATDTDGDTLTYEIWDSCIVESSGYFELNGSAYAARTAHTLTEAEFSQLNIVGGDEINTDTLSVRVSDGVNTTKWESFTLNTLLNGSDGGTAPTVTANNLSLNIDDSVQASSVFNVSDADGDTLTYEIWDSSIVESSGYFELNGSAYAARTAHTLTEAEFSQLNIVGGDEAGTEKLWVRVSDGITTTKWEGIELTTTDPSAMNINEPDAMNIDDILQMDTTEQEIGEALEDLSGTSETEISSDSTESDGTLYNSTDAFAGLETFDYNSGGETIL